jgi:hypothetical protein
MEPQVTDATGDRPETIDQPPPPASSRPESGWRLWTLALVAATLAGVVAWLGGEAVWGHFVPPEHMVPAMGGMINAPKFADRVSAERKNASLANGILGCSLGLALGLAGGLARRSTKAASACSIAGSLIGLGVGVGASEAILPIYFHQVDKAQEALSHDLILPLLIHCGIWSAIGAAGGVSLGLGLGLKKRIASVAFAGLIGGALGAGVYELIGALAFPTSLTTDPLAIYWAPRLMGKLAVTLLATTLAVVAINAPAVKKPAKSEMVGGAHPT